jgi:hypothetical protein
MPVLIFLIKVEPASDNPEFGKIAGAYVNCFVVSADFEQGEETALKFLEKENWLPITLEETWQVTEADYEYDPEGLAVYQQVLTDGSKYTFHTYVSEDD